MKILPTAKIKPLYIKDEKKLENIDNEITTEMLKVDKENAHKQSTTHQWEYLVKIKDLAKDYYTCTRSIRCNKGNMNKTQLSFEVQKMKQASGNDVLKWVEKFEKARHSRRYCLSPDKEKNAGKFHYSPSTAPKTASDYVVRGVLKRVIRSRKISSLHALMALSKGRARRSNHDDITACVIDLAGFVSCEQKKSIYEYWL